jgi:HEAT repeat protein
MSLYRPNVDKLHVKRDVKGLIRASKYRRNPTVRCRSAAALSVIGGPEALDPLLVLLHDEDPVVREILPAHLAEFAERHQDPELRQRIAQALIARTESGDDGVRQAVIRYLPRIVQLLEDSTWCLRAAEAMLDELKAPTSPAEHEALLGLRELAQWLAGTPRHQEAINALEPLLEPGSAWDLGSVARQLAALGKPPIETLIRLLDHENHREREEAALLLKELFEGESLSAAQKTQVLNEQARMARDHQDYGYTGHTDTRTDEYHIDLEPHHADHLPMSDCADHGDRQVGHQDGMGGGHTDEQHLHTDRGIGVELQI